MSLSIPKPILVPPSPAIPSPILVKQQSGIPSPIMVKPASNIPSPIFVRPGSPASPSMNLNNARVRASVMRSIDGFFRVARQPSAMGPMNPERFPSTDVTPRNEFGVSRTAYDVNGELWVKTSAVVPNAKPAWYDLGKMPTA